METNEILTAWAAAELAGSATDLDTLLHPEFVAVGPAGFVLTKQGWLDRFTNQGVTYSGFEWHGGDVRRFGDTAVVVGWYTQAGTIGDRSIDGSFSTTHIVVDDRIVGLHISNRMVPQ
ncbi:nuclear transport factor 2 family protein [Actinocrispum wychmicini]|uniref:Uncharacterized protein DUF4440 n=1 Tax=Actinocrispum wychmicini TaxID=1213861 RepID=A0A4R2IZJ7_9PSEU|nr:nuclear transport factor 2 family protein [Actinocrispum wychmicini]TCO49848.1 uncharacterized protein DUF4440 [Actinocrispum wychmicini]